jgi:hypothetical protein
MLIFTNRSLTNKDDESAFGRDFITGSEQLGFATASRDPNGGWRVSQIHSQATDSEAMSGLLPLFSGAQPLLIYLHGNNNSPAKCFERCDELERLYKLPVVAFSWASEGFMPDGNPLPGLSGNSPIGEPDLDGVTAANRSEGPIQTKIRRYRQAKTNAQDSVDAVARFLRLLATARLSANRQPFTIAAHSLGAHLLQYSMELSTATEAVGTAQNVALLAACVRASGHKEWLAKLRVKGQVFVTFNQADLVLFGARIADGNQIKLGAEPGTDLLQSKAVRYISFSHAQVEPGGHHYFVNDRMPAKALKLFTRIFSGEADIQAGEFPRKIYPVGCDDDGLTCYMAAPDREPG